MRHQDLQQIRERAEACTACPLHETRNKVVFGSGSKSAKLMLIGEAPGRDEDKSGEPFVGKAGQELDRLLASIGEKREDVYITNVVKCRPMYNRNPEEEECEACRPYLIAQLRRISPKVVIALGQFAIRFFVDPFYKGKVGTHREDPPIIWDDVTTVVPTYHPAYILRQPQEKHKVLEDFKRAKELCDI